MTDADARRRPQHDVIHTACGRTLVLGRMRLNGLDRPTSRVTLDVHRETYDGDEVWASLTPAEARRLADRLLRHASAAERDIVTANGDGEGGKTDRLEAHHVAGESYTVTVRGHELRVDQPATAGGDDSAPTPTELFVASLASCVAFYVGRYLSRHGVTREGLRVGAEYELATDRPARVSMVRLLVSVSPELPPSRRAGLLAVAEHCTVHNTVRYGPAVSVDLA